ncbi:hypothetical protein HDU96_007412, partial [Phlyctochytrium bullatum]
MEDFSFRELLDGEVGNRFGQIAGDPDQQQERADRNQAEGDVSESGIDADGGVPESDDNNSDATQDAILEELLNFEEFDENENSFVGKGAWKKVVPASLVLDKDYAEVYLKDVFMKEVTQIALRLAATEKFKIGDQSVKDYLREKEPAAIADHECDWIAAATPWDLVRFFLALSMIPENMRDKCQTPQGSLDDTEIDCFVRTELLLVFYGVSPSRYFGLEFEEWYN